MAAFEDCKRPAMFVYWMLLAIPALMALVSPVWTGPIAARSLRFGTAIALGIVAVSYVLLATLREEIGADWFAYLALYDYARELRLTEIGDLQTDPLFSLVVWVSATLGLGVYVVNGVCAALLVWGVVRLALLMREPWLTIVSAIPYLLIVVGMGYIRQAAAIGLVLMAIHAIAQDRPTRTIFLLVCATGFHSTTLVAWPLFILAIANRNKLALFLLGLTGAFAFYILANQQISQFSATYIEAEYQSSGATVRVAMSFVASLLILARWRTFEAPPRTRTIWLGFALASVAAFAGLSVSSSTTAIDRLSLYFSIIQLFVFGNLPRLLAASPGIAILVRMLTVMLAAMVQVIWLVYAAHADAWVPYRSLLSY